MLKAFKLIPLLFLLCSCRSVYRQLDSNNKPVATENMVLSSCDIHFDIRKTAPGDNDDYHLYLSVKPSNNNLQLKVSDIITGLSAYPSDMAYKPIDIKFLAPQPTGENGTWVPPIPTLVNSSQTLDLKAGTNYTLVYSFWGYHHRLIKLDVTANINGETVKKTMIFKKHTDVQLLH